MAQFQPILSEIDTRASQERRGSLAGVAAALQGAVDLGTAGLEIRREIQKENFAEDLADVERRAEEGLIEFSEARGALQEGRNKQNESLVEEAKGRINTLLQGEAQGKLSPTRVNAEVSKLFKEAVSRNPEIEQDLRRILSSSGLTAYTSSTSPLKAGKTSDVRAAFVRDVEELSVQTGWDFVTSMDSLVASAQAKQMADIAASKLQVERLTQSEAGKELNSLLSAQVFNLTSNTQDADGRVIPPLYEQFRNSYAQATTDTERLAIVDNYSRNIDQAIFQINQISSTYATKVGANADAIRDRHVKTLEAMKSVIDKSSPEQTLKNLETVNNLSKERSVAEVQASFNQLGLFGSFAKTLGSAEQFKLVMETMPRALSLADSYNDTDLLNLIQSGDTEAAFAMSLKQGGTAARANMSMLMTQLSSTLPLSQSMAPVTARGLAESSLPGGKDDVTDFAKQMTSKLVEDGSLMNAETRRKLAENPKLQDQWSKSAIAKAPVLFVNTIKSLVKNPNNADVVVTFTSPEDGDYLTTKELPFFVPKSRSVSGRKQAKQTVTVSYKATRTTRAGGEFTEVTTKREAALDELNNTLANLSTFMDQDQLVEYVVSNLSNSGAAIVVDGVSIMGIEGAE